MNAKTFVRIILQKYKAEYLENGYFALSLQYEEGLTCLLKAMQIPYQHRTLVSFGGGKMHSISANFYKELKIVTLRIFENE